MHVETGNAIKIRFALPSAELRPFVTTYYSLEAVSSPSDPWMEDYLHPEWPNLRFMQDGWARSAMGEGPTQITPAFAATGTTSRANRFGIQSGRSWGIGLLPLGWAAMINAPASDYADSTVDGNADPAFAAFRPLAAELCRAIEAGGTSFTDGNKNIDQCQKK